MNVKYDIYKSNSNDSNNDFGLSFNAKSINTKSIDVFLLRKKRLFEKLNDNKLEYKSGDCESFIKFGIPVLDTVVKNVEKADKIKTKRLQKLLNKLREENEPYDERIFHYKHYINNGGNLDYHVNEGIKEWFYLNKTDYLKFLKSYKNEDKAQSKAFNEYVRKNGMDRYTERIKQTEMVVRLY